MRQYREAPAALRRDEEVKPGRNHSTGKMRRRTMILFFLALLMGAGFAYPRWASSTVQSNTGRQRGRTQRRARVPVSRERGRDYSKFLHASTAHRQQSCSACHDAPTPNWRQTRGFPDVADYPGHDSCIKCHRQQFFTGARPSICTICHTRVSPRDDARFAFPKPASPGQFNIEFPHDKHQDVIASHVAPQRLQEEAPFVRASFTARAQSGEAAAKRYNNCAICHETLKSLAAPHGGWRDGFIPAAETFKSVPTTHASCFNCHWKTQEPTKDNCAGCHKLSTTAPRAERVWFTRISLKFTHAREQHTAECTTCHINITGASTLLGLRPDVPVTSCSGCHKTSTDRTVATIETELEQRKKDPKFTCAKCHTSDVGSKSAPPSHYALFSN